MLYQPTSVKKMWDTWMFFHEHVFYLFYLVVENTPGEGVCLATSTDGVHWHEKGLILPKSEQAQWLGTGSIWKSLEWAKDGKFVLNFSEWYGSTHTEGQQVICFAESTDLMTWQRMGSDYNFAPDPNFYKVNQGNDSRWDCIYSIPRPGGGRYGYWTANPLRFHPGFGFGETLDGVHWRALEPPAIEWGDRQPMELMEAGAIELIDGKYWMMVGTWSRYQGQYGMVTLVADRPQGPFRPVSRNFFLLSSQLATAYFARFFPHPHALLVNHHVIARAGECSFAPLKQAFIDAASSTLRLKYWPGNEAVKGKQDELGYPVAATKERTDVFRFPKTFDASRGAVIEGWLQFAARHSITFLIDCAEEHISGIRIDHSGVVEFGIFDFRDSKFEVEDRIDRQITIQLHQMVHFRLLVRHTLLEFYLNDELVHCHNLPSFPIGTLGFHNDGSVLLSNVSKWDMTLNDK